ncbi:LuxR family transcriptional regulator [soil metagenome]
MSAVELSIGDNFAALLAETDADGRWEALTLGLARIGLDQVNYAFLDIETHDRMQARGSPAMSTMRSDWIDYYIERQYDLADPLVDHVRASRQEPILFETASHFGPCKVLSEASEAGLNAGVLISLPGSIGMSRPGAGIVMGSTMGAPETFRLIRENGRSLVALANLFHAGAVGELMRRRYGAARLTPRERDCLQHVARGSRISAIAFDLELAEVTVGMHLKNARKKLGARSLPEAVARGLLFQQIEAI